MVAVSPRVAAWAAVKPHFQAFVFRVGFAEARRATRLSQGTIYNLVNALVTPSNGTLGMIERALGAGGVSKVEQTRDTE